MKLPLSKTQKGILLIIFISLFTPILVFVHPADPRKNASEKLMETTSMNLVPPGNTDSQLVIYKKVRDSLEKIINWKKQRLSETGSSVFLLFAGLNSIEECDSCMNVDEKSIRSKKFISFAGFVLKRNASFRIEGNDYIIDRLPSGEGGHLEQEKIGVRLAAPADNSKGLTLLVPISASAFNVLEIVLYILFMIAVVAGVWIFIRLPIRVLINIGYGKPFLVQNIRDLNLVGWGIIVTYVGAALLPKLIELLLSSRIPSAIYFPFWSTLYDNRGGLFFGIAVLILAKAFKQGYKLQQEQDLTV